MASPTLVTPKSNPKPLLPHITIRSKLPIPTAQSSAPVINPSPATLLRRRDLAATALFLLSPVSAVTSAPSAAQASDDEYVKEAAEVINKVRSTITMDRNDPNVATAVAELRNASNSWVAKYRREKSLLGKPSFRDIYSALNAVSGHYISFGPTAPIPAKRKARILEEMDSAEKALQRGR